jgi:hypothetical protein
MEIHLVFALHNNFNLGFQQLGKNALLKMPFGEDEK